MADFQTFDLGRVFQTAEAIKGARRQSVVDDLQQKYLQQKIDSGQADMDRQSKIDAITFGEGKAKQIAAKAQFILQSNDPKGTAEQIAPEYVDEFTKQGGDWSTLTPDQIKMKAQVIFAKASSEIGQAPPVRLQTVGDLNNPSAGVYQVNPVTNATTQVTAPQKADLSQETLSENIRHNKAMEGKQGGFGALTDTTQADTMAQMIAAGQMPMPTGRALLSPLGQYLTQKVHDMNPDFSGANYPTKAAALKAFTSGAESKKVRSLNTAIAHMASLDELATALNNKDTQAFNRVANFLSRETGGTAVTNFNAAKELVAKEVISAVIAGGGGQAEREEAAQSFNAANSPQQLAQVTAVYRDLLGGQLHSLAQQYEQGTERKDFDRFLTDRTKQALGNGKEQQPQAPQGQPAQIKSDADYASLPSGAEFIAPDGSHRRKP